MEKVPDTDENPTLKEKNAIISALREENDTLHKIIELLPGNVYWKNIKGEVLGCNKNMIRIAGDDIIGKSTTQLFGEENGAAVQLVDEKVMRDGKEHTLEEHGLNDDNQPAIYLSKKLPLYNSQGEITGTMGISFDITERKKMEEELKIAKEKAEISNRVKSQFVAAVNHELRTPLASILGLVDILKGDELTDRDIPRIMSSIESSAQHLLNLVDDVLDFSKLESGKQYLQITPINFRTLLSEIQDLLYPLVKTKDLALNMVIDQNLPPFLQSDVRVLRHILINLINNGIKYTTEGEVTVRVHVLKQNDNEAHLKISITDTGMGIPEDKLDVIFKPFHQLNNTRVRSSSRNGAGLGLTIVKKLAQAIEGTLDVESTLGKGSTFSLTATFTVSDEKIMSPHRKLTPEIQRTIAREPIVLIVEDDPIIQYIHRKLLKNLGCIIDTVANSADAMRILNDTHDLILLDMSLPDGSGYDLIKKIRETTSFNCPIVVISAFIEKEEEAACLEAGASDSITKPLSQAKLKELLARYCPISEKS